jgi:DNA repair protein RadC
MLAVQESQSPRLNVRECSSAGATGEASAPHYLGHRERLRARFLKAGAQALADYELLELVMRGALSLVRSRT